MKSEKETKQKLQASAKQEFLEKGYMKASLRNICKNAGVTTGALYFFFEDKEDLFASLVEEHYFNLYKLVKEHFNDELNAINNFSLKEVNFSDYDYIEDVAIAKDMVHYMYLYYDEFELLLNKSQGSKFENCIEEFVKICQNHYMELMRRIVKITGREPIDEFTIHWFAHMNIDYFVQLIKHKCTEQEAVESVELLIKCLASGWCALFK